MVKPRESPEIQQFRYTGLESHGKLNFCFVDKYSQMSKQGQCKSRERQVINQRKRNAKTVVT